jgi:alkylated DNA nucleotide flippase Atl1
MKRLPWWRKNSEEETQTLHELSILKDRQRLREELREKQKELKLELKNIKMVRRKLRKDDEDED